MARCGLGILAALIGALAVATASASANGAHTTRVRAAATCESAEFAFAGFPEKSGNTVTEHIKTGSKKTGTNFEEKFTFNGASAANTINFAEHRFKPPPGEYTLKLGVTWKTNGIAGESTTLKAPVKCTSNESSSFTIEKFQRFSTEPSAHATKKELTGEVGQTIDYSILISNTGTTPVALSQFEDKGCQDIKEGAKELAVGGSTEYSCQYTLTGTGTHENKATVTGSGVGRETSNAVVADVPPRPAFTIVKSQRLEGQTAYTTSELQDSQEKPIEYQIVITNTGNVGLTFPEFSDANCTDLKEPPPSEVGPGHTLIYTCKQAVSGPGPYTNTASVEGDPPPSEGLPFSHTSNEVLTRVPVNASIEIEKQQRIGSSGAYTTSELNAQVGNTVEYKIIVTNTGNVAVKVSGFSDAACENIKGTSGELPVNGRTEYTCEHKLTQTGKYSNVATVEGSEGVGKQTSNTVTVNVPRVESFAVEKQQRIGASGSYTTGSLTAKLDETAHYKIIVTNTGNVSLKFKGFSDPGCENIVEGSKEVPVGGSAEYTCEHKLTEGGTYTNQASIEAEGVGPKTSNPVSVFVEAPAFTIEKRQRLGGSGGYTPDELTAKLGETVEYEIVITNTGNVPLKFHGFSDSGCEGLSSPPSELPVEGAAIVTCSHTLGGTGAYANEASIEGEGVGKESSKVTVNVPVERSFTIEKLQAPQGGSFVKTPLTLKLGETVDYKIVVTNTGNVKLKLSAFADAGCSNIKEGAKELGIGASTEYTCEYKFTEAGSHSNIATITGEAGSGNAIRNGSSAGVETSNEVVAQVPVERSFTVEKLQRIGASSSFTRSPITGKLGETVEYEIVITNTGNAPIKLRSFTDTGCVNPTSAPSELGVGASSTVSCTHTLMSVGPYTNVASIESEGVGSVTSNEVTTTVEPEYNFTIEKLQRIGSSGSYVTSEVTGKLGETVEYEIVVKNTGNVPLKLSNFTDSGCEDASAAAPELPVHGSTTVTCTHVLSTVAPYTDEASIEGEGVGAKTSNKVLANVLVEYSFTIEKLQRIGSSGSFTKSEVLGKIGEVVDYEILVKNTSNVPIKFSTFSDPNCTSVSGVPGELQVNATATITCSHTLSSVGTYANEASIQGEHVGTKTSNKVMAKVEPEYAFTIEKLQRIGSSGEFTGKELVGKLGETVDYEIVIKNTGNVPMKFSGFSDPNCTSISGVPGEVAAGGSATVTCSHTLSSVGAYTNEASIEGEGVGKKTSDPVTTRVEPEYLFTIEKLQRIGSSGSYTKSELTAKVGETVDYQVIIKNTGNVPMRLSQFTDAVCENTKEGLKEVAVGASTEYTCEHLLTGVGKVRNEASIEGEGVGRESSNTVVVSVPAEYGFTIEKLQRIGSSGSFTKSEVVGKIEEVVNYEIVVKNTGNVPLKLSHFNDTACEGLSSVPAEVAVHGSATVTCMHTLTAVGAYSNEASIEGEGVGTETSNTVTAKVEAEPAFTIEKLQRVGSSGSYTKLEVNAKLNETIDYEVIVKNTGNVPIKLKNFSDAGCENISSVPAELAVGGSATITCSHQMTQSGPHVNEASIEGEGVGKETSNRVTADVVKEYSFTIQKQQKIGSGSYTSEEIAGKVGQTVLYRITIKNTGNTALTLKNFKDTGCTSLKEGSKELAVGEETTYSCEHQLAAGGKYENQASVEAENVGSQTSNTVVVFVEAPAFAIEKLQRIGSSGSFTKHEVTGKLGEVVNYEILVKNTGNVSLKLKSFSDAGCEGLKEGSKELAVGAETTYTCEYKLTAVGSHPNTASVEAEGVGKQTSNEVLATVPAEYSFAIEKLQRTPATSYTKEALRAKVGETVNYEIIVKNTGNVPIKLSNFSDPRCENQTTAPSELAVGASGAVRCTHVLTGVGSYVNEASIEGEGVGLETSNKVTTTVEPEYSFTIEKLQRIGSGGSYTKSELTGKLGEVVNYEIVVKNTGNEPLKFSSFSDSACQGIAGVPSELPVNGSATITCSHTLEAVGSYSNEASIENEYAGKQTSNKVTTKVEPEYSFTIEKLQRIGSSGSFVKSEVTGKLNETVNYEIVVKNTGNVSMKFSNFSDSSCEGVSGVPSQLAAGASATITCSRTLSAVGSYSNEASIEGEGVGKETSNKVTAKVNAEPAYTIEKLQRLGSSGSYVSSELSGKVGQLVEYRVIIKNTGNVPVKFSHFADSACEGISGVPSEVTVGSSAVVTCSHMLTGVGSYANEASIEGEGVGKQSSNKVVTAVPAEPGLSIEKLQRIGSSGSYTSAEVTGKINEVVNYEIVLKNTGNVPVKLSHFSDANCEGLSTVPSELPVNGSATVTCTHTLATVGSYANEASVEGEGVGKEASNKVVAKVNAEPAFTIEKLQRVGSSGSYTKLEVNAKLNETIDYEIVVRNTGNVAVKFKNFSDPGCEGVTGVPTELAVGASATITCTHKMIESGVHINEASIEGEGVGKEMSNAVVANVVKEYSFTIRKQQKVGSAAYTSEEVSAKVGQVVLYRIVITNTGNTVLNLKNFEDKGCINLKEGAKELSVGGETTYACEHLLTAGGKWENQATVEGEHVGTLTSNTVVAFAEAPAFTIEKLQRIGSTGSYTSAELTGKIGEVVNYEILLKNTGNVPLKLSAFKDEACTNVKEGSKEVAVGSQTTYTCEHTLSAVGSYNNEASIEGEGVGVETSNKVTAKVNAEPSFTVEKLQRIGSSGSYTKGELTAKLGEVVEYEIVVKNTGNVTLKLANFLDGSCEHVVAGASELEAGKTTAYTCEHTLTTVGAYDNQASIEAEGVATETTNMVVVNVPAEPAFTIEKLQRISGESSYTKSELAGKIGQTVEYEIVVKDTGNVALKFSSFTDSNCEAIVAGASKLSPGQSTSYTCTHTLKAVGAYSNEASVEANEGAGRKTSNKVTVTVAKQPAFTIEKLQRVSSSASYSKSELGATLGQTAEYEVVVTNTGNTPLKFGSLTDPNCTGISGGPGANAVEPGASSTFTCEHQLIAVGSYSNEASVEGNEGTGTKTSNKVTVKVTSNNVCSAAPYGFPNLGGGAQYALFAINGTGDQEVEMGNQYGELASDKIEGAVAVGPKAKVTNYWFSEIIGNVYVDETGEFHASRPETIHGTVYTGQQLLSAHLAAIKASEEAAKLTPNTSYASVTSNTTVKGSAGLNVVEIGELKLNNATLTLEGPSSAYFVVNVTKALSLVSGSDVIKVAGGAEAKHVLINYTAGVGHPIELHNTQVRIEGTLLAVKNGSSGYIEGTIGSLIIGGNFSFQNLTLKYDSCYSPNPEPSYTIEKEQRIAGETQYTKSELSARVGQKVEYAIAVRNTGNTSLSFSSFKDEHCESITGGPSGALAPEQSATWTCVHTLGAAGKYTNEASVTGSEGTGTKTSNQVVVNAAAVTATYTIEKLQKLSGESSYTKGQLTAKIGQTVDYEIVVKNTGNVPLTFSGFSDERCTGVSGGPGGSAVAPGASTTWTCSHELTVSGEYSNEASVEGSEKAGKETSNKVSVTSTGQNPCCPTAPKGYPNLGNAGKLTFFALDGTGEQRGEFGRQEGWYQHDTINGEVAAGPGVKIKNLEPSWINGNVYVDESSEFQASPGKVNGTIYAHQHLNEDHLQVLQASEEAEHLPANITEGSITKGLTIEGKAGLNVIDVTGEINLDNASLTLSGPSSAYFVVNVAKGITLNGSGGIVVGGEASHQHVVINMSGSDVNITSHPGNTVEGTLLAPEVAASSLNGTFGTVVIGGNFSVGSGLTSNYEGC